MSNSQSTQPQRDKLTAYLRAHNVSHKMLDDGRMQIKIYSRFDTKKAVRQCVAFVERNGSASYGRQAVA